MVGPFVGTLLAAGHHQDTADALFEAVQVKLLGEQHRGADPENIGVGRIAGVGLAHRVGARVGAALGGQDQDFAGAIGIGSHCRPTISCGR
ncbi:hypothetical protein DESC_290123 [Desulfosarcina cetonica]|nr:hypothetical protein DESC_290123 [Desulfosarcina cetonica]